MGIYSYRWCNYTTEGRKQGRTQKKRQILKVMLQLGNSYFGCVLFCIGKDTYKLTREGKSFIEIRRAEDNGIDLFKAKQKGNIAHMYKAMHSKTSFDEIETSTELLNKIIGAVL